MTAEVWADSAASLAAALGLVIVIRRMGANRGDPLARRFRWSLGMLAALMLVRVADWTTGLVPFAALTTALAGAVPLAAVLVAEGLTRRHAPSGLKWAVLLGAAAFAGAALMPATLLPAPLLGQSLMVFQLLGLAGVVLTVLARDRTSLSAEENRSIDRMLLALALILPLLAGDFRSGPLDLPIRTGAIGILGLAWLSLGLGHAAAGPRGVALGFLGIVALAGATALVLAELAGLPLRGGVQVAGVVLCALLLLAIALEAHALRAEARADSVLRHLAEAPLGSPEDFLADIETRAGVEGARLLGPADLGDFDLDRLTALFRADPLRSAARPGAPTPEEAEQLAWLFTRFEASHALMIGTAPLRLLVLNRPAIGGAELADLELRALQRMAALLSARS